MQEATAKKNGLPDHHNDEMDCRRVSEQPKKTKTDKHKYMERKYSHHQKQRDRKKVQTDIQKRTEEIQINPWEKTKSENQLPIKKVQTNRTECTGRNQWNNNQRPRNTNVIFNRPTRIGKCCHQ